MCCNKEQMHALNVMKKTGHLRKCFFPFKQTSKTTPYSLYLAIGIRPVDKTYRCFSCEIKIPKLPSMEVESSFVKPESLYIHTSVIVSEIIESQLSFTDSLPLYHPQSS